MPLKLKERNCSNKHSRLKNLNRWEALQLAIYKHDLGVEYSSLVVVSAGLKTATSAFISSPTAKPLGHAVSIATRVSSLYEVLQSFPVR